MHNKDTSASVTFYFYLY